MNYKRLGDYIREVNIRNTELKVEKLLGVSIQKAMMPSIANTVGTDMSTYKIMKRGQFAYGPVTSRNGDKISIALLNEYDEAIISQAYTSFEVLDREKLLPEYLMMWFRRPEFDRYARFKSHGSAREIFDWDEMCNTELPIPSPEKQREIVAEYNAVQHRIDLNNQLIQKLEETAQAIYKQWFIDFEFPNEEGKPYKSSGGEMLESELGEIPRGWRVEKLKNICEIKGGKRLPKEASLNNKREGRPYIKVADMSKDKYIVLSSDFEYVDNNTQKAISKYIVSTDDVIISIVGTIGLVSMIDKSLNNANLTENCFKLTNLKELCPDLLYYYLNSPVGQKDIETRMVGGVQAKLPMYNVESMPMIIPNDRIVNIFKKTISSINELQASSLEERHKLIGLKTLLLSKMATIEN
ncbi:MAG: restriction endonuclease subunit S [Bacteroidales bacterium]|jgi:type I restriction enzyme S subunit|nr:restriction endonuclease subunit S [Bacteroidales bacterium]